MNRKKKALIYFGFTLIVIVAPIIYLYPVPSFPSPKEPAGAGDLLAAIVPGVFSFLLAALYWDMTGIQETRNELDRASREPHISVKKISANGDIATFELKNIGDGIAKQLSVVVHLYIRRIGEEAIAIGEPNYPNKLTVKDSDNLTTSIESGETQKYSTEIYLPSQEYENLDEAFKSIMTNIKKSTDDDITDVYLQFEIQYDHQMPDRGRGKQYLQLMEVSLDKGFTMEAVNSTKSTAQDGIQSIISASENTLTVPQTMYE